MRSNATLQQDTSDNMYNITCVTINQLGEMHLIREVKGVTEGTCVPRARHGGYKGGPRGGEAGGM